MVTATTIQSWVDLECMVDAFEEALSRGRPASLDAFCPPVGHPLHDDVLTELIRIQLEHDWKNGHPQSLDAYRQQYPKLFEDASRRCQLAFEEYRLRMMGGQDPTPQEYADRFEIDLADWPESAEEPEYPQAGDEFLGFEVLAELGRGAMGRVYLALQGNLANRLVVLKVSTENLQESQRLARLQHTHVVPIFSVHAHGPLHVLCMPFLGAATLQDVLSHVRSLPAWPETGEALFGPLFGAKGPRPEKLSPEAERARQLPYAQAVLWFIGRLAVGLAHAHERGILHQDLKPANVLLNDEGLPLLLDFSLAVDLHAPPELARSIVGGTLPYMSPEQLQALSGESVTPDARADVYSLGKLLYELLTGSLPYPRHAGEDALERAKQDHAVPAPFASSHKAGLTPAIDAIIARALAISPAERYASAKDLAEDLELQLRDLPLKHAPNRSLRERLAKWARRHPKLSSTASLAAAGLLMCALAAWALGATLGKLRHLEAEKQYLQFQTELQPALYRLNNALSVDQSQVQTGMRLAERALARYQVLQDSSWRQTSDFQSLSASSQTQLQQDVRQLLLFLSEAPGTGQSIPADAATSPEGPPDLRRQAATALTSFSQMSALQGSADRQSFDLYLTGRSKAIQGRYREAAKDLQAVVQEDPKAFWAWFVLGRCHDELGDNAAAIAAYDVNVALWPGMAEVWYNRGLAKLRQERYAEAKTDLDACLQRSPNMADALINRGLCLLALGDPNAAVHDLSLALKTAPGSCRILLIRAKALAQAGRLQEADQDLQAGLSAQPEDAADWVARGMAQLPDSPEKALSDFEVAARTDPRYLPALQNQAAILAEMPGRTADAIAALNRVVEAFPDFVPARSGRGVLHARLGNREAALQDAQQSLLLDPCAEIQYQAAGIYALTSKQHPEDSREAFRLLGAALTQGYGLSILATDSDLDPIRPTAEFQRLQAFVEELHPESSQ